MTVKTPVYLDCHATTPMDPRVLACLQQVQTIHFGNPASAGHALGWAAAKMVDEARCVVASLIGATDRELIFTSGATEANNLAILGVAAAYGATKRHLVTTQFEHESVAGPIDHLERQGWRVSRVKSNTEGRISPQSIADVIGPDTALVSVMAAQNEIGTVQPIADIGAICKEKQVLFHTDAVQAVGSLALDVQAQGIDLLSVSAHKIYGPKGVGALFVRRRNPRVVLTPLQFGGDQERGLRPGTPNVPGIVAFAEACRVLMADRETDRERLVRLRDQLWERISSALPDVYLNGGLANRLPGNLNISFAGVQAHRLLGALTVLAVSSSSACSSGQTHPSKVLTGLGVSEALARASLRIGLGRFTTEEESLFAAETIISTVERLRA